MSPEPKRFSAILAVIRTHLHSLLTQAGALALLPTVLLGGFWLGGERMLIGLALGLPICLLFAGAYRPPDYNARRPDALSAEDALFPAAAAPAALAEAHRHGPSLTRGFGRDTKPALSTCNPALMQAARAALENGQIQPWYQPQISTDTGQISGFEALARWVHPEQGLISPAEFLPIIEQAGAMERLDELMLYNALSALRVWDAAGIHVPQIGVNFSPQELRNPNLVTKIEWELDRFDLPASRLSVEILETVVALSPDDIVVRNIAALAKRGCQIDLDDFGTGHASISSIRRFAVQRLKIDRSFVSKVDRDPEQQRMVAAILTMAEQLGLATLAEGVETAGEHAILAQLGCGHVQGFSIGRPLPLDQTIDWMHRHLARLQAPPTIGRHFG